MNATQLHAEFRRKAKCRLPTLATEADEQRDVVAWLEFKRHTFCAIPNSGQRSYRLANWLRQQGLRKGAPDLLLFGGPDNKPPRVALEMKRKKGGKLEPEQQDWLLRLSELGWVSYCAHGADDAIEFLQGQGY